MQLSLAVMADYANLTTDNKLNIMGIFGSVVAPTLPFELPPMQLVLVLGYEPSERDGIRSVEIELVDADAASLLKLDAAFEIPQSAPERGEIYQSLALAGLTFPRYGSYSFYISTDGERKRTLGFSIEMPTSPAAG